VINMDVWNKISAQDQQIMLEVAAEAEQVNRDFITDQVPAAKQLWQDTGIPILTPTTAELSQWQDAFSVVWGEYTNEINKGVPDIQAILKYWESAIEKAKAGMFYKGD
jgi:TRAP-type C4-dicarboxylate transport system substrate-binding protein